MATHPPKDWRESRAVLTQSEVAKILDIDPGTVRALTSEGEIRALIRRPRCVRYAVAEVRRFLGEIDRPGDAPIPAALRYEKSAVDALDPDLVAEVRAAEGKR